MDDWKVTDDSSVNFHDVFFFIFCYNLAKNEEKHIMEIYGWVVRNFPVIRKWTRWIRPLNQHLVKYECHLSFWPDKAAMWGEIQLLCGWLYEKSRSKQFISKHPTIFKWGSEMSYASLNTIFVIMVHIGSVALLWHNEKVLALSESAKKQVWLKMLKIA